MKRNSLYTTAIQKGLGDVTCSIWEAEGLLKEHKTLVGNKDTHEDILAGLGVKAEQKHQTSTG